ncbi:biopolymer transporter ExbD [bacterium]|nr:biopolymer transporter ExbD [bacterium]
MIPRMPIKADVSFVNLIDVTLVLLIIFMITAPAMHQFLDVELPAGKASKANISEGIVVSITKDGTVFIDREKTKTQNFRNSFSEIWKKRSGEPVFINADREVPYGSVIDILGYVKEVGGENVGLVVEEPKKSAEK